MARVMVIDTSGNLLHYLVNRLSKSPAVDACQRAPRLNNAYVNLLAMQDIDIVVYCPRLCGPHDMTPDLAEAEKVVEECARASVAKVVLLSSAAVYGASPRNPGFISESQFASYHGQNRIGERWIALEALAAQYLGGASPTRLTILRPASVPLRGGKDYFSQLLQGGLTITLPLHDPSIQLLHPDDLAQAVCCAVERSAGGVYNVAPDGVIPLRVALRLAGSTRVPIARGLQRLSRRVLSALGAAHGIDQLEYIRFSWTISNKKIKQELGFIPERSSAEALTDLGTLEASQSDGRKRQTSNQTTGLATFDDFGMDTRYIDRRVRTVFKLLHDYYWRIEVQGIEQVPRVGRAVLAGNHRGFMPFDGVMAFHHIVREVGRYPRVLIHPTLLKIPVPFDFAKLGGIKVSRENADYVLQRDELLIIYPEGIEGAFRFYREAYRLGKFGRDEYVKAALRNRAPIVPFVTVGSAEIFPIFGKIDWRWWKEYTWWPFIPITPTFPLLPLPLPTKWHTQFLPPLHIEQQYPPEAAGDAATVRAISQEVRGRMQDAIDGMLTRRKAIFFGSIFHGETGQ
jgi:1-acyl-sn-glycerol-3-phosphate acyltransferase/nucleoside-diphosphate-sugar epimerase